MCIDTCKVICKHTVVHDAACMYACVCVLEHWSDTLLYVKNVGEDVTEEQLKDVFVGAEDVVIPKPDTKRKDDKKTK